MIVQKELIILVSVLALLGGAFAYGYHKGTVSQIEKFEADRIELQDDLLDLNVELNTKNDEILRLSKEREGLINDLENQAYTAEGSAAPGVATTGGLQRLEERWSKSPTTSK